MKNFLQKSNDLDKLKRKEAIRQLAEEAALLGMTPKELIDYTFKIHMQAEKEKLEEKEVK